MPFDYKDDYYHSLPLTPLPPPTLEEIDQLFRLRKTRKNTDNDESRNNYYSKDSKRQMLKNKYSPTLATEPAFDANPTTYRDHSKLPMLATTRPLKKPPISYTNDWKECKLLSIESTKQEFDDSICSRQVYQNSINLKKKIFEIDSNELKKRIRKYNPYELVGNGLFINRSAIKLMELDYLFNLTADGVSFVDLCGGPGGFTEYLYWKRKNITGFGITLKGVQDYQLSKFKVPPTNFHVEYGQDSSGDIYQSANISKLSQVVLTSFSKGVDLVVADGGFSVEGDEEFQEHHSKQLLLCETLAMFKTLKKRGNFIIKLFDTVTPFTCQLIYILYLYFQEISFSKPLSSRPLNSEKYLICKNFKEFYPKDIIEYLDQICSKFQLLKPTNEAPTSSHTFHQKGFIRFKEKLDLKLNDVINILDPVKISKDSEFVNQLDDINNMIYFKQKEAFKDVLNDNQLPFNQKEIAKQCLKEWTK
jgi:23S rRNA U2552 (ribose-2'-O)-methylase RlmE/FtsJ